MPGGTSSSPHAEEVVGADNVLKLLRISGSRHQRSGCHDMLHMVRSHCREVRPVARYDLFELTDSGDA